MKPDGKAAQNKRIKKLALMETAYQLFSENGIGHTSISDIAEKAGVGKGTFYSYFKDKYDIRNHIIAKKSAEVFAKAKHALDQDSSIKSLEDTIVFMTDNVIDQLTEDKLTLAFIHKNLSWGVFRSVLTQTVDMEGINFSTIFESAITKSKVKYKDPIIMIYLIIEMVSGSINSSILYNEPMPIQELKKYLYPSIRAIMKEQQIH